MTSLPIPVHHADDQAFNYYGRWQRGPTAVAINSGAFVEFACTGAGCELLFDVGGFTQYPAIHVQVDNGAITKTTLSREVASVAVRAALPGDCHLVRWWVASHSLYLMPAQGRQWATLDGGCRFRGVIPEASAALVALPYGMRQIEFLGDSITQGLRLLYAGADDDTGQQVPYANWPQYVADLLDMKPVVVGFGGQGLTTPGTCGALPAGEAFPFVFHGTPWVPPVQPEIVVIYQGTNDPVDAAAYQARYVSFLRTVRGSRPAARVFAVCPHLQGRYAGAIRSSVAAMDDARIHFLDYSAGVIAAGGTSDGCHLNPGGAVRLGVRLASDIIGMS